VFFLFFFRLPGFLTVYKIQIWAGMLQKFLGIYRRISDRECLESGLQKKQGEAVFSLLCVKHGRVQEIKT